MPSSLRKSAALTVMLAATACSAAPLEHYIMSDPPDASIYVNGKRVGKGDNLLHQFDFSQSDRVWISAVHPDWRAETKSFTANQIRRYKADRKNIPFSLGR